MPIEPKPGEAEAILASYAASAATYAAGLTPPPADAPKPPPQASVPFSSRTADITNVAKMPDVSASEARQMADALVKSGVSPAAVAAALALDGIQLPAEDTSLMPKATDYRPDLRDFFRSNGRDIEHNARVLGEMQQVAADLRLPTRIGDSVLEHLSQIIPAFTTMNDEAKAAWLAEQERIGAHMAKSPAAYLALREKAATILQAAQGTPLGKALAASPAALNSHWLVSIINTFAVVK